MSVKAAAREAKAPRAKQAAATPLLGEEPFLRLLGERVREARARRGMTRRILARDSGVSERYLAELESGSGNVSVLRLRQVARALNLPLIELVREDSDQAVALTLIAEFLKRLSPQQLAGVRTQLLRDYGSRQEARRRIALIGLRGAGKSTLGQRLARELNVPFFELDREIEREAGTSLNEIFLLYGQAGYRRYERRCLERIIGRNEEAVIATGGSIVSEPGTYELLLTTCYTVWLKTTPQEHMARVVAQGDTRPIEGNRQAMEDLKRILAGRAMLYGQADTVVETAGKSIEQSLAALKKALGF